MKVLLDHPNPFALAHGGFQIQIEQTKGALESVGVEVEFMHWWNSDQTGDLIHFFGRPTQLYIQLAQSKGMKVVMSELLTGMGSRSGSGRYAQRMLIRGIRAIFPAAFIERMAWASFQMADACVALTEWEAQLMRQMFDAPTGKVHVVANGVEEAFFQSRPTPRGPWLVCTATVTERKRVLELAQAAVAARTPVWIIGKPYSDQDIYARRFFELLRASPEHVRYEGAISDRVRLAQIYREARGFVLLSTMESLSLSALEATACECPLLLSDLPWARCTFGTQASFCEIAGTSVTAKHLKWFYDGAPNLPVPKRPKSWKEIAIQLRNIYERLLTTSR